MRPILLSLTLAVIVTAQPNLHDVANDSANIVTKILGSFQGTSSMNLTQLFSTFDMPSCLRRCMPSMDNVGMFLNVAKNPEIMKKMCQNLTEASKCAASAGCDATFVGAISNAFQFACLDNVEKLSSQIGCIQENAGDLQQECENECAVQADMIDNAAKNTADQLFNMEKICNSTTCIANCYQNNLDKYCDIGEGNFLDTIFSQFESLQEQNFFGYVSKSKQNTTGISKLLGIMMPDECKNEKFKIKIPKKIAIPEKPKSVGASPSIRNELPTAKKSLAESKNVTEPRIDKILLAKSGNLSSAALMYAGKIRTLQCQFLDNHGNPQSTPDFETLSEILSEHFNKKAKATTPKPINSSKTDEKSICRGEISTDPQLRSSSGSFITITTVFAALALKLMLL